MVAEVKVPRQVVYIYISRTHQLLTTCFRDFRQLKNSVESFTLLSSLQTAAVSNTFYTRPLCFPFPRLPFITFPFPALLFHIIHFPFFLPLPCSSLTVQSSPFHLYKPSLPHFLTSIASPFISSPSCVSPLYSISFPSPTPVNCTFLLFSFLSLTSHFLLLSSSFLYSIPRRFKADPKPLIIRVRIFFFLGGREDSGVYFPTLRITQGNCAPHMHYMETRTLKDYIFSRQQHSAAISIP